MEVSVSKQLYVFAVLLLSGAASGAISDFFMQVRIFFGRKRITTGIADLVLWIVLALGIFFVNLYVNNGELRWYAALALILGAVFYFMMLSRLVRPILNCIFFILKKILLFLLKIVLTMFGFLYKIVKGIYLFFLKLSAPINRGIRHGARKSMSRLRRTGTLLRLVLKKK